MAQFTKAKWSRITKTINDGLKRRMSYADIAKLLDENGIKKTTGKKADKSFVTNCLAKMRKEAQAVTSETLDETPQVKTVEEAMVPVSEVVKPSYAQLPFKEGMAAIIAATPLLSKQDKLRYLEALL